MDLNEGYALCSGMNSQVNTQNIKVTRIAIVSQSTVKTKVIRMEIVEEGVEKIGQERLVDTNFVFF